MYKFYVKNVPFPRCMVKFLIIIKLSFLLLIIPLLQVNATARAQNITVKKNNVPLIEIFRDIRKQTSYDFLYSSKQLINAKRVSINVTDGSILDVLDKCFKDQPFTYSIENKTIIIKEKISSFLNGTVPLIDIDVHGRVVDETGGGLVGAVIKLKDSKRTTITNEKGEFTFKSIDENAVILISYLGFKALEVKVSKELGEIRLEPLAGQLKEVNVVSTGYETIPKERATGSFVQIDNQLLNRRISTGILDRLEEVSAGLFRMTPPTQNDPLTSSLVTGRRTGITIRGKSTIYGSAEPLIVLDNFPYEGEINNINPNDIESITILKDAAAASIWGARSGNGVIVITTKKGRLNQKMKIDFNSNIRIVNKPNLFYSKSFLDSKDYIEVEQYLFNQGYFDNSLNNTTSFPVISPSVELMVKMKTATTDAQRSLIQEQLDELKSVDVRNDYEKYVYQKAINQQYSLGIRGGNKDLSYTLSVGHDNNKDNLVKNGFNRTTINSLNTYNPIKNLELTAGLNYSQSTSSLNNSFTFGSYGPIGALYSGLYPYALLADNNGNPAPTLKGLRSSYLESTRATGFLDWNYRPLDEINLADNTTKVTDLVLRFGVKYQIIPQLSVQINYQNERQLILGRNYRSQDTYYVRDLINKFSNYDGPAGTITYGFPKGGTLDLSNNDWNTNNIRGQLNYAQSFKDHNITAIAGAEIREVKVAGYNKTSYGYNDQFGTAINNLNYAAAYPINPSGSDLLPPTYGSVSEQLNRYISYYSNLAYSYKNKYIINLSARKDGANLYGADTNDKITPLWSAGLGWDISKESFYDIALIPKLKIRSTYGYNGNTFQNSSAYLIGVYGTYTPTGAKIISGLTAPNPQLRWEKIRNINVGIDFASKNNTFIGTIELYKKNGQDLIQPTSLAPQTGFLTYQANTASTKTSGIDITLQSQNLKGKFKWNTVLLFSTLKDKIVRFSAVRTAFNATAPGGIVGKSQFALYSYKWAYLNPINGNPRGYLNGQVSENYSAIINNFNPDSLTYNGSIMPTIYGAVRNDFLFRGFNVSFNITYQFKSVFRRPSINVGYSDILNAGQNSDYTSRWQKPGDEISTNVPSLVYPSDYNRNFFYQNSEVLIEHGDFIRLKDIKIGYQLPASLLKKIKFSDVNFYTYADNLGFIWRKNKSGIDPSIVGNGGFVLPNPFSISFGLTAKF